MAPSFSSERLAAARLANGWTARQLGSASGVSEGQISKYESGKGEPSLAVCGRLALALKVSVGFLIKTEYADMNSRKALAHASLDQYARTLEDFALHKKLRRVADQNPDPPQTIREWTSHRNSLEIAASSFEETKSNQRVSRPLSGRRMGRSQSSSRGQ